MTNCPEGFDEVPVFSLVGYRYKCLTACGPYWRRDLSGNCTISVLELFFMPLALLALLVLVVEGPLSI
jgi:hypothetical protein